MGTEKIDVVLIEELYEQVIFLQMQYILCLTSVEAKVMTLQYGQAHT